MRLFLAATTLLALARGRPSDLHTLQARAVTYNDPETGFTFSESRAATTLSSNIIYRIAIPANVPANQAYDIVLQAVVPNSIGWAGLAWGGSMVRNPLTVAYPNGQMATVSSRWATGHSAPAAYTGATYTLLSKGNKSNGTHWQFTAKCTGCTSYTGANGATRVNPSGSARLGYAAASAKVSNPSSTTAQISVHDVYNYITHDFSAGANANFANLLASNGVQGNEVANGTLKYI